jgi:CubicO group peptidase (beta-lactamase class C family)
MKVLSRILMVFCTGLILLSLSSCARPLVYPGETWKVMAHPEKLGFSHERLQQARAYADTIDTTAVVIVKRGRIVYEWGDVDAKFNTHSMRKSFLSAMYGKYVQEGAIDIDREIGEIGIDDEPPLSDEEKKATLRDCLKARSGIYHPALYESQGMKDKRPQRHTMKAGTHWYYNNWDFNVLGTVFEKMTGKKLFAALYRDITNPIGMENFQAEDGTYITGEDSIHQAYPFKITARDLARFGLLMLRQGRWNDQQIIPRDWVHESTSYHSDACLYGSDGYGYMWWVVKDDNKYPHLPGVTFPAGTFSARGFGGHYLMVIPAYDLVIVHRVNTYESDQRVAKSEIGKLMHLILQARVKD